MLNQGSGNNGEWTFLDLLSLVNFIIGLQNLDMNIDQNDMQELQHEFNKTMREAVQEVHQHLEIQDEKIDEILKRLEGTDNDNRRDLF